MQIKIDTSKNSDAQKKSYFHSVLEKNYRTIVIICVSLFMLTIILSSILFTKKSPPIVDESTEEAEQEDETKVHLPKSNNANSLRAYNFAMTILMLSGAVYLIFSSNQCTEKKIGCFNFTFRLFFLFWFVSSFVLSIRTVSSKFLTSKLLETFLLCINIGVLLVYVYKFSKAIRTRVSCSIQSVDAGTLPNNPIILLPYYVEEDAKDFFLLTFVFILILMIYLNIVINIYAWKLGYGRNDDEANPYLGKGFMIFQIIWFVFWIFLSWYFFLEFFGKLAKQNETRTKDMEKIEQQGLLQNFIKQCGNNVLELITAL